MIPSRRSLEQAQQFLAAHKIPYKRRLLVCLAAEFDSAFREGQEAGRTWHKLRELVNKEEP